MNAFYLHKPDGTPTTVAMCGVCGRALLDYAIAERCCRCGHCGNLLSEEEQKENRSYHSECSRTWRAKRELAQIEKAILAADYNGPVYYEGGCGSYGDGYFSDVQELADYLDDQSDDARPSFAFCCTGRAIFLDVDRILENATEEAFEDASEQLRGVDALRTAISVFNKETLIY